MKRLLALHGLLLSSLTLFGQTETPPPGPPPGEPGGPPPRYGPPKGGDRGPGERGPGDRGPADRGGFGDRDRDRRGGGSGGGLLPGYGGRPPMRHDAFDKLPEADKKRVREALDKVWSRPEVMAARDKAMRAHEEMRDTIRDSLTKTDPEAAAILAKVEPENQFDARDLPRLPETDAENFPEILIRRMGLELLAFSRPDRREETRRLHEKVLRLPQVNEALAKVKTTRGEERIQAVQQLRAHYREAVFKEFKEARERRSAEGGPPPRPPEPPAN